MVLVLCALGFVPGSLWLPLAGPWVPWRSLGIPSRRRGLLRGSVSKARYFVERFDLTSACTLVVQVGLLQGSISKALYFVKPFNFAGARTSTLLECFARIRRFARMPGWIMLPGSLYKESCLSAWIDSFFRLLG